MNTIVISFDSAETVMIALGIFVFASIVFYFVTKAIAQNIMKDWLAVRKKRDEEDEL